MESDIRRIPLAWPSVVRRNTQSIARLQSEADITRPRHTPYTTVTAGEIAVKQLRDVHNMSWDAIGPQYTPETVPVYAFKIFMKVCIGNKKAASPSIMF